MGRVARFIGFFILGISLLGCSEKSSVYTKGSFDLQEYNREEVVNMLSISPMSINHGKPFTRAGIIELFLIEGNAQYTAGKKTIICRIYQYLEVDDSFSFDIEGPECCVSKEDDYNFDLRPKNSLFTYRISFDPKSGSPSIRMLSGSAQHVTLRYSVRQFW